MRYHTLIFAVLMLSIQAGYSFAEKVWTSFSRSNEVFDIAAQGDYVWCATENGPVRWDRRSLGYTLFNTIPDSRVTQVELDAQGNVWFGTRGGLFRLDHETGVFSIPNSEPPGYGTQHKRVTALAISPDQTIWFSSIAYGGMSTPYILARLNNNGCIAIEDGLGSIRKVEVDASGKIWWPHYNTIFSYDGKNIQQITRENGLPMQTIDAFAVARDGTIWVGSGKEIYRLRDGIWTLYYLGKTVNFLYSKSGDIVWAGTPYGLYRFVDEVWESYPLTPAKSIYDIKSMLIDDDGVLWVGTVNGLVRIKDGNWTELKIHNRIPPAATFNAITTDPQGNLWVTFLNYFFQFNGKNWISQKIPSSIGSSGLHELKMINQGDFWFRTTDGDVLHFDETSWTKFTKPEGLNASDIRHFDIGVDNSVWLSTLSQLFHFTNGSWNEYTNAVLSGREVLSFAVVPEGFPVIGTYDSNWMESSNISFYFAIPDSLLLLNSRPSDSELHPDFPKIMRGAEGTVYGAIVQNNGTHHHPGWVVKIYRLKNGIIQELGSGSGGFRGMSVAMNGTVWLGAGQYSSMDSDANGGGLYSFNQTNSTRYDENSGLLNISILSVAVAPDGTVWVGHPNGLTRYGEPLSDETVISSVSDAAPAPIPLLTNRPNPFNPSTTISFTLPMPGRADLTVYDITGRKVRALVSQRMSAGAHSIVWDGRDNSGRAVSSGVYLARLTAGKHTESGKMLLMK